jgi:hypothetical protein
VRRVALMAVVAGLVALAGLPRAAAAQVITAPDTAGNVGWHTSLALDVQGLQRPVEGRRNPAELHHPPCGA